MKRCGESKGFTLVELVVVIAILGILAAVAVPSYSGYVSKAKEAGDMQILSSVATAVQGSAAGDDLEVDKIVIDRAAEGGTTLTAMDSTDKTVSIDDAEVKDLLGIDAKSENYNALDFKAAWKTATMDGGEWQLAY